MLGDFIFRLSQISQPFYLMDPLFFREFQKLEQSWADRLVIRESQKMGPSWADRLV